MNSQERRKPDCSDLWREYTSDSADVNETLALKQAKPGSLVNINTMHGDVINLGPLSPEALAEFLAARRRR